MPKASPFWRLGDSLTAGYGLQPSDAFPVKLEAALKAKGHDVKVVNAGVSGDTALDGFSRLDWSLSEDVDAVIVELGANDALRGLARAAGGSRPRRNSGEAQGKEHSRAGRRHARAAQPGA